jgi:hypothetical protein
MAGLATSIAREYQAAGGSVVELFAAYAGLVLYSDSAVGCESIEALEAAIKARVSCASAGSGEPFA